MTHAIRTWFQADNQTLSLFDFCGGQVTVFSRPIPAKSTANEDAAAVIEISDSHGLLVVADGVGGANAGDRAARHVVDSIVAYTETATAGSSVRSSVLDAIEAANGEVLSWGLGAASTLVVVEYLDGSLRTIHAGDSTALVCSNRGRIKFTTIAHAPVAMAVESGMLEEVEGLNHEDRHLITNCVGSDQMKIELGPPIAMAARDTLVLGSDGLFDNLTKQEVVDCVRAGRLEPQVSKLLKMTADRMNSQVQLPSKPDDLTVICFRQG